MHQEQNQVADLRRLSEVVSEYNAKVENAQKEIAAFEAAANVLTSASCVAGTWGDTTIDTGRVHESCILQSLLKSGWRHVYDGLSIERIASAEDKRRFAQAMQTPAPLTLENIRATFGKF